MRSLKSVSTKLPDDPAEARVAIAKDVIAQIRAERLNVASGNYILATEEGEVVASIANDLIRKCEVCAKGAIVLCALRKYDGVLVGEVARESSKDFGGIDHDDVIAVMRGIFSVRQLGLIEAAFEQSEWFADRSTVQEQRDAVVFGDDHENNDDRLLAIMQNIVDHGGEFKPEVRYDIVTK